MENNYPPQRDSWKMVLTILCLICIALLVLCIWKIVHKPESPKVEQKTISELIKIEEISSLAVYEFSYNGIVNDNDDYLMYKSTVKVAVDPEKIKYTIDEENKKALFIIPELTFEEPVIDIDSLRFMEKGKPVEIDKAITICRKDALRRALESDKLLSCARDNLKGVIEAWYSPILNGYEFEFTIGLAEGGDEA